MKIIGLTGGIGSGKSTVSWFLAELGAVIIDADKVGHDLLRNPEIRQELADAFGKHILDSGGYIDRNKLGQVVFDNSRALEQLNQIIHPRIGAVIQGMLADYRQQGVAVVVLEAPLLVETGSASMADEVWVTVASEPAVLQRIKERSGLSEAESLARIRSQASAEERAELADVIINNDGNLDELRGEVERLWQRLKHSA